MRRVKKKRYKNRVLPLIVPIPCVAVVKTLWLLNANVNAPQPDDNPIGAK